MSAQEQFFDAQIRHQLGIQRLSAGDVKRTLAILRKSDEEITALLKRRARPGDFTSQRYKVMLKDIKALRRQVVVDLSKATRADLRALGKAEQQFMKNMLNDVLPVKLDFAAADAARLSQAITQNPFTSGANGAMNLSQWWNGLAAADANRITNAIQMGMVQGESIDQMVARVMTATDMTRNNATAVIRTGVNHVSNAARNEFFLANSDVVGALMWSAMLDGRTTLICAGKDGHHVPVDGVTWEHVPQPHLSDGNERPPAHVQCRSFMMGILNQDGIAQKMGNRPTVRDTRTRRMREKDFRADSKAKLGADKWKSMTPKERNAAIAGERRAWAKQNIGSAPGKMNYDQWLRKQPREFQDEVLGKQKGIMFRKGMKMDKFTDKQGGTLTLDQLKELG